MNTVFPCTVRKNVRMKNDSIFLFKEPTIHKLQSGRWHISFKCVDDGVLREVRQSFGINRIKNKKERTRVARYICADITKALYNGWNYFTHTIQDNLTVKSAFKDALRYKKLTIKKSSYESYKSTANIFIEFIGSDYLLSHLSESDVFRFVEHRKKKGIRNKTMNKNIEFLRALTKYLHKEKNIHSNPFECYEPLKIRTTNVFQTFSEKELSQVFELLEKNPNYKLWCLFIFYAGIRPSHLVRFQRKQICFETNTITIHGDNTKNSKSSRKQLLQPLKYALIKAGIESAPKSFYLFGKNFEPNEEFIKSQTTRSREQWKKLVQIPMNTERKQYCLKHTFAQIMNGKNVNLKWLQQLFEHSSIEQTETYINSSKILRINEAEYNLPDYS